MGCGGSRSVREFVNANPNIPVGNVSDFENVIVQLETFKKCEINKILKVSYYEKSKCAKGDAQEWKIQAAYSDLKKEHETYSVYVTPRYEYIINYALWID